MSTLVHSIRRRTLVVGLVVASFAGASGSAFAASEASPYGYAMQYTPKASAQKVAQSPYGYAVQYTPKASAQKIPESLYGYAMQYTPKASVKKIAQRPKVVVERTVVRCDVPVGDARAGDLARCE